MKISAVRSETYSLSAMFSSIAWSRVQKPGRFVVTTITNIETCMISSSCMKLANGRHIRSSFSA